MTKTMQAIANYLEPENIDALRNRYLMMASHMEKRDFIDKSICKNHGGKMTGMWSISTSCMYNERCKAHRRNGNSICAHCYAWTNHKMRKGLALKLIRNSVFYSTVDLEYEDIPYVNVKYFRLESFGDLINERHVRNYFMICEKNPETQFALWTKNADLIQKAMDMYHIKKPDNLIMIHSSLLMNQQDKLPYDYCDKVFTVYNDCTGIPINCGSKKCLDCRICYTQHSTKIVNEKLK